MIESKNEKYTLVVLAYAFLIIMTLFCVMPFIIVISSSLSTEKQLIKYGFSIFPRGFTLEAYKYIYNDAKDMLGSYKITIFVTLVGSVVSVFLTALTAYPLSRPDYKWRKGVSFYLYFTMIFKGGAIPSYILISQYLNLKNNILVLILPMLLSVWNIFLMRTYLSKIHISLIEAAKIDGASEFNIFLKVVIPMSRVALATILLLVSLAYWNDWYLCLMYMTNNKIITLQYYLYRIMSNINEITSSKNAMVQSIDISSFPSETARMAMCVVAAGPMIFMFMFLQKYFSNGLALGSVKG